MLSEGRRRELIAGCEHERPEGLRRESWEEIVVHVEESRLEFEALVAEVGEEEVRRRSRAYYFSPWAVEACRRLFADGIP